MIYKEDIDKALLAHGTWKQRLNKAISTNSSEFEVSHVQSDDRCEFGKWFYGLPAPIRKSEHWIKIQKLHAEFHAEAARILQLALDGQNEEAIQAISRTFKSISGQLALAFNDWKKNLPEK